MNNTEEFEASSLRRHKQKTCHSLGEILRVVAVPDGQFIIENQGEWSGPITTILCQITERLPHVKRINIIRADTLLEANDLVRRGHATLNITPQTITPALLGEFAALAISAQPFINVLFVTDTVCDATSLATVIANFVASNEGLTAEQIIEALVNFFATPDPTGIVVVNTEEQYEFLVESGVGLDHIVLITTPITNYTALLNTLEVIANAHGVGLCDVAFLGNLAVTNSTCFTTPDLVSTQLIQIGLNSLAEANFIGWIGPKYAPKLWLSLQMAFDAWLCNCGVVSVESVGTTSCNNTEKCLPYAESCLLSAPPRLFSLCKRFIPDYAMHEFLMQELCVDVHSVAGPFDNVCVERPHSQPTLPDHGCITASDISATFNISRFFGLGVSTSLGSGLANSFDFATFMFPYNCISPLTFRATAILNNAEAQTSTFAFTLYYRVLNPITGLYGPLQSSNPLYVNVSAGEIAASASILLPIRLRRGDLIAFLFEPLTQAFSRGTATICC